MRSALAVNSINACRQRNGIHSRFAVNDKSLARRGDRTPFRFVRRNLFRGSLNPIRGPSIDVGPPIGRVASGTGRQPTSSSSSSSSAVTKSQSLIHLTKCDVTPIVELVNMVPLQTANLLLCRRLEGLFQPAHVSVQRHISDACVAIVFPASGRLRVLHAPSIFIRIWNRRRLDHNQSRVTSATDVPENDS
jgi:hypothetical protein